MDNQRELEQEARDLIQKWIWNDERSLDTANDELTPRMVQLLGLLCDAQAEAHPLPLPCHLGPDHTEHSDTCGGKPATPPRAEGTARDAIRRRYASTYSNLSIDKQVKQQL